jgi:hypothetical protein
MVPGEEEYRNHSMKILDGDDPVVKTGHDGKFNGAFATNISSSTTITMRTRNYLDHVRQPPEGHCCFRYDHLRQHATLVMWQEGPGSDVPPAGFVRTLARKTMLLFERFDGRAAGPANNTSKITGIFYTHSFR